MAQWRAQHGQAELWRYTGALGKTWRLHRSGVPVHIREMHAELLHACRAVLMPFMPAGEDDTAMLGILAALAGRRGGAGQADQRGDDAGLHRRAGGGAGPTGPNSKNGGYTDKQCGTGVCSLGGRSSKKVGFEQRDDTGGIDLLSGGAGTCSNSVDNDERDDTGGSVLKGGGAGSSSNSVDHGVRDDTGGINLLGGGAGDDPNSEYNPMHCYDKSDGKKFCNNTKTRDGMYVGDGSGADTPGQFLLYFRERDGKYVCDYRNKLRMSSASRQEDAVSKVFRLALAGFDDRVVRRRKRSKGPE